ncbi:MAG TPA: YbdD/YjiX family protein [Methylophilus sp.]|nr:YbdD/YjiX family protein [Methylophilus sp.]HQQ34224.1 YbdD/YjiX family protein [Methylophilus sp.]
MLKNVFKRLCHVWHLIRRLSGDDAYEQYLRHHLAFHANTLDAPPLLSRKEFYKLWQDNKWQGIKRCC